MSLCSLVKVTIMAAIRVVTGGLLSGRSLTQSGLSTRFCPLLEQTRHRNKKKTRFKAPPEPKHKDAWDKGKRTKTVTVEKSKPTLSAAFMARVPVDDVWIRTHYPRPKFSIEEALTRHIEFADPSMLDNMEGFVYADMELNMKTNKKTKFLSNVKGTVLLPHQFEQAVNPKIAIFCKTEEDLQKAKHLGASFYGCEDLVKQILDGLVDRDDFDVAMCTVDAITELIPIRAKLRDKFPSKARGSVGSDIEEMWTLYTKGVTYSSQKESDAVGKLQLPLGQLKMSANHLVANFNAYIEALCAGRAKNLGPLITQIFILAPPSTERFLLPVEDYVPGYEKAEVKQDEEDSDDEQEETLKG